MLKIIRRTRSPDHVEFSHFTLLFCRGRQKCVKIYNARAQPLQCKLATVKRFDLHCQLS